MTSYCTESRSAKTWSVEWAQWPQLCLDDRTRFQHSSQKSQGPVMRIQRSTARANLETAVNEATLAAMRMSGERWKEIEVKVPGGQAYNEEAFRYFLEIERKRSEASGRPLLLLLVDLVSQSGFDAAPGIDHTTADRVLSALALSLRETDFVGWHLEGRA